MASSVEGMLLQVEEISQEVFNDRNLTNQLLQDKLEEFPRRNTTPSLMGSREDLFTIKTYRIATPLLLRLLTEREILSARALNDWKNRSPN